MLKKSPFPAGSTYVLFPFFLIVPFRSSPPKLSRHCPGLLFESQYARMPFDFFLILLIRFPVLVRRKVTVLGPYDSSLALALRMIFFSPSSRQPLFFYDLLLPTTIGRSTVSCKFPVYFPSGSSPPPLSIRCFFLD